MTRRPRHSRRLPLATAAATLAVALSACGGGGGEARWEVLPESRLAGRFFPASAWTGAEMLMWGGGSCSGDFCNSGIATPLADGAAFDPAAGDWRPIAGAPLSGRLRAMSAWTGEELVVWGGNALTEGLADGAAYNPSTDSWRRLAASPLAGRFGASSVWTGEEMIIWGGGQGGQNPDATLGDGAAYDPATDSWRRMSPSPLAGRTVGTAVWTGIEVVYWGGSQASGPDGDGSTTAQADGAAYNPSTDRWRPIAASPLQGRGNTANAWTGREVVIWGGGDALMAFNDGAAYDPATDSWRPLADSPLQPRRAVASAWSGTELLIWGGGPDNSLVFYGDGAAYDPDTDSWRTLASWNSRFAPAAVWTGAELLVWGGIYAPEKIEVLADGARLSA